MTVALFISIADSGTVESAINNIQPKITYALKIMLSMPEKDDK
jgi:hypothetical protein